MVKPTNGQTCFTTRFLISPSPVNRPAPGLSGLSPKSGTGIGNNLRDSP